MNKSTFKISKNTLQLSGFNYENLEFSQLLEDQLYFKTIIVKDKASEKIYLMKTIEPKNKYPEEKILKEIEILEKIYSKPSIPSIFLKFYGYIKTENSISGSIEYNLLFENPQSNSSAKSFHMNVKLEINEILEFYNKSLNGLAYLQSIDIYFNEYRPEMFFLLKNSQQNSSEYKLMVSMSENFEESKENGKDLSSGVYSFGLFMKKLMDESSAENIEGDMKAKYENLMKNIGRILQEDEHKRPDFLKLFRKNIDLKKNILEYIRIEEGLPFLYQKQSFL